MTLANPAGAVILAGTGTGIIVNDDGTPQPPAVQNDTYSVQGGSTLDVAAPGVLGNDASPGSSASAAVIAAPAHGALTLQPNGAFTYTPQAGYIGADAFTYRATNNVGTSAIATVALAVTAPAGPQPPTAFRVVGVNGNVVTFGWNPPALGQTPLGYQLEGGVTPGGVLGAVSLGTAPRFTIALPSATLYIRLRTVGASGLSAPTADITVPVNQPVPPSAPANLVGLASGQAVSLAWRSTFTGGAPAGAVLDVSGGATASLSLGPVESFDFPNVPPGTYTFVVRQVNASGVGSASNPVALTFPAGCTGAPPPVEKFVAFTTGGRLVLAWDPPSSGAAPTSYLVQATGAYVGNVPLVTRGVDVPVAPGSYTLSVRAVNACGSSAATAAQTVVVP
ncbi:MAG: Ig-like domain-containing protein [Vicinamibacterales bacterium]